MYGTSLWLSDIFEEKKANLKQDTKLFCCGKRNYWFFSPVSGTFNHLFDWMKHNWLLLLILSRPDLKLNEEHKIVKKQEMFFPQIAFS